MSEKVICFTFSLVRVLLGSPRAVISRGTRSSTKLWTRSQTSGMTFRCVCLSGFQDFSVGEGKMCGVESHAPRLFIPPLSFISQKLPYGGPKANEVLSTIKC